MIDALRTTSRLVTGIEPDDEEKDRTRVYIDARYLGIYVLVSTQTGEELRRTWTGHMFIHVPESAPRYKEVRPAHVEAIKP